MQYSVFIVFLVYIVRFIDLMSPLYLDLVWIKFFHYILVSFGCFTGLDGSCFI